MTNWIELELKSFSKQTNWIGIELKCSCKSFNFNSIHKLAKAILLVLHYVALKNLEFLLNQTMALYMEVTF